MKLSIHKGLVALTLTGAAFAVAGNPSRAAAQSAEAQKAGASNIGEPNTGAQSTAPAAVPATSLTPAEILRGADKLTNIRAKGSTPFHLKAHIVATGPVEFTGDGDYEETWLAPDRWVEEIHFGAYHSIETRDGTKRSFQANRNYQPIRVLYAVRLMTYELPGGDSLFPWTLDPDKTSGDIRLLPPSGLPVILHPDGTPAQDGQHEWSDYEEFSGKRVARILQENSPLAAPLMKINITQLDALPPYAVLPEVSLPDAVVTGDPGPYQVGKDSVTAPKLIYAVDPKYPTALGKSHVEGVVVVGLIVDTNGAVREPEATSATNPLFIPAAIKAVSGYKFEPARRNGTPVQVSVNVEVQFRLY